MRPNLNKIKKDCTQAIKSSVALMRPKRSIKHGTKRRLKSNLTKIKSNDAHRRLKLSTQ